MQFHAIVPLMAVALVATAPVQTQTQSQRPPEFPKQDNLSPAQKTALLQQINSPNWEVRRRALLELVTQDTQATLLADPNIRAVIIRLLQRETDERRRTRDGRNESEDFQYYEDFLMGELQKLVTDYHDMSALKALAYSIYGADSELGRWLVKQHQAYPFFFDLIDNPDSMTRSQGLEMLGKVCASNRTECPKIVPLLRNKVSDPDQWTHEGAIVALGTCGTEDDLGFLKNSPACSQNKSTAILCGFAKDHIAHRLKK